MEKLLNILLITTLCISIVGCSNSEKISEQTVFNETSANTSIEYSKETETSKVEDISKIPAGELTEDIIRNYPVASAKDFEYEIDGEGIKIKKYLGNDTVVVIPDAIEGKSVTAISMLVFGNDSEVRGVYIPKTISVIKGTFTNNSFIEVVICEGIESVEFNAFNNCFNLHTFVSGENFAKIGDSAFAQCLALKQLSIPQNFVGIEESTAGTAFYGCTNLTIIGQAGSTIEAYAKEYGINFQAK